jgi:uncharacterized protein
MKYFKMSAFVLLYLSVYFIIQSYIGSIIAMIYTIKELVSNRGIITDPGSLTTPLIKGTVIILIFSALISFPIYWFAFWLRKENIFKFCRFSKLGFKNILFTSLLSLSLVLPVDYLVSLLSIDKLSPNTEKMFNVIFEGNGLVVLLLGIGIIGPVIEEIIFRGLIYNELRRNISTVAALLIQAFLFGVYHMNLTQGIYAFALGIILGLVCTWTRSLWSSILIHMVFNSTSVVLTKIPGSEPRLLGSVWAVAVSFVTALALMIIVVLNTRKTKLS